MAPKKSNVRETTPVSTGSTQFLSHGTTTPATVSTNRSPKPNSYQSAQEVLLGIWKDYFDTTPQQSKLIDAFMAFLAIVGVLQFVYCIILGNYPFNAFLSGFSATVGEFVLTASLRIQTNIANKDEFPSVSHERAFADYVFSSLILQFFCVNFIN